LAPILGDLALKQRIEFVMDCKESLAGLLALSSLPDKYVMLALSSNNKEVRLAAELRLRDNKEE
jgi:hypothetical protein